MRARWRLGVLAERALAAAAALSCWVAFVNREVLPNSHLQGFKAVASLLAACLLFVVPVWRAWRGPWLALSTLTLLGFGALEVRDAWLRRQYQATSLGAPEVSLLHPVTTLDLAVHHYRARLPSVPASGLRFVQLTDLHITEKLPPDYYVRIVSELGALRPDIIVLTGDYLSSSGRLPMLERWLKTLPHPRLGIYAVLGNHEHWLPIAAQVATSLQAAGVVVLAGQCATLSPAETGGLRVCGTDAPWGAELLPSALAASEGAPRTPFVVLSHTPDNIYELSELGAFAVFSGHTHAGQIRLPWWGAVFVPSRYGRRFDTGHFLVGSTHLYVSQGIGADSPPIRLWCRPELSVLDLSP
jgi:uncharacterized protein